MEVEVTEIICALSPVWKAVGDIWDLGQCIGSTTKNLMIFVHVNAIDLAAHVLITKRHEVVCEVVNLAVLRWGTEIRDDHFSGFRPVAYLFVHREHLVGVVQGASRNLHQLNLCTHVQKVCVVAFDLVVWLDHKRRKLKRSFVCDVLATGQDYCFFFLLLWY